MPATKSKYPTTLGVADLKKYEGISDVEIQRDIADTEEEIAKYRRLLEAEQTIAKDHPNESERRMANFRATCRPQEIREREEFVAFLQLILRARAQRAGVTA